MNSLTNQYVFNPNTITASYKEVPKYIQETRSEIVDLYTEETVKVKTMHNMFNQ